MLGRYADAIGYVVHVFVTHNSYPRMTKERNVSLPKHCAPLSFVRYRDMRQLFDFTILFVAIYCTNHQLILAHFDIYRENEKLYEQE